MHSNWSEFFKDAGYTMGAILIGISLLEQKWAPFVAAMIFITICSILRIKHERKTNRNVGSRGHSDPTNPGDSTPN